MSRIIFLRISHIIFTFNKNGLFMQIYQVIIFLLLAMSAVHDSPRVIDISDLQEIKSPRELKLSPDGKKIFYTLYEQDKKLNKRVYHIWQMDLEGNNNKKITDYKNGETNIQFSEDNRIAFLSLNEGKQNIYSVDYDGNNKKLLFPSSASITSYLFSKDKEKVFYLATATSNKGVSLGLISSFFVADSAYPISELWCYDIKEDRKEKLLNDNVHVKSLSLSHDGEKLLLTIAPNAQPNDEILSEIYILYLNSGQLSRITNNKILERSVSWSNDGKTLYFLSDANEKMEIYYQQNIFRIDTLHKKSQMLMRDFKHEINSYFLNKNNNGLYFNANLGVTYNLFFYDFESTLYTQLTNEKAVLSRYFYDTKYDFILFTKSTATAPDEICMMDKDGKNIRRISNLNPWISRFLLGRVDIINWRSSDSVECEGLLYYPAKYDSSKKYPLIVQLHGGPAGSYTCQFQNDYISYSQVLSGKGYFVFQPNYRGSTGYGDEFMRAIICRYFEKDPEDVISGVNYLIETGKIDKERIGVHGWSAGGHLTNWLVTHSNIFKAASAGAGMCNWLTFYETTEMKYLREIWFEGSPKEKHDDYYRKSPVLYVKNITTPLLLMCGTVDKRVPYSQSVEMYEALKKNGKPVELISFPGNGHGLWQLDKQVQKMEKEIDWFRMYLN